MNNKVLSTILKHKMLSTGDAVMVALSGGADSVALLRILLLLKDQLSLKVSACHVNHGIRGAEAEADEQFVRRLCKQFDVPLTVFHVDVPAYCLEKGISTELGARELRYASFQKCGNLKIATAHTLSDNLETILFSMMRGTGLKGLCGIPPQRGNIIRPLLEITRQEIEDFLTSLSQEYVIDSSNLSAEYTRNALRLNVVPSLLEIFPSGQQMVGRMVQTLQDDQQYLEEQTSLAMQSLYCEGGYNRKEFMKLATAIAHRVLLQLLTEHQVLAERNTILRIRNRIEQGTGVIELRKGFYLKVMTDYFFFQEAEVPKQSFKWQLQIHREEITDKPFLLKDGEISIRTESLSEIRRNSNKKNTTLLLDYDKISDTLIFRNRKEGDRLSIAGRSGSKSLKKLFNELKISPFLRQELIVLETAGQVVGVENCGVDRTVSIDGDTSKVIVVDLRAKQ